MNCAPTTMLGASLSTNEGERSPMTEWEYEVTLVRNYSVPEPIADALNESGGSGWELVAALPTNGGLSGPALLTILKRPKGANGLPAGRHLVDATAALSG